MKYICSILAAVFYLGAFGGCLVAKTSVGEIGATLLMIAGTLFFAVAVVVERLDDILKELRRTRP